MANAEPKRMSPLRFLVLVLALTLLGLGVIGALVTLFAPGDRATLLETSKEAPQVRRLERDSLRQADRNPGS